MINSFAHLARRGFVVPGRMQASYNGAGQGRRAAAWKAPDSGPATAALGQLRTLRNRSRAATRNDPYAASAINHLVSGTIGTGIAPRPSIDDDSLRHTLQDAWNDWTDEADADGITDFYGLQAMVARVMYESGECFVRLRPRRFEDGLSTPLQLQVLEPEFVPHEKNDNSGGNVIRAGIEFNAIGQRVAYWMYQSHPGDGPAPEGNRLVRVPADQVIHVFEPLRAGQLRGIPVLATILARLKSLDDFDDAVLFRQELSNLFTGFVRKPAAEESLSPLPDQPAQRADDGYTPLVGLEPGTMQELLPGEEVEFSTPPGAGGDYPDFMRQQLMAAAAGVGVPFEILTGDMRSTSDRTIRVALTEFRRRIEQRQFSVFIHQFCRPVRAAWMDAAVLSGAVALPNYAARRREYLRTRWAPQGWAYIHPVQDIEAQVLAINNGLTSRSETVLRQGYDAELIDAEIAADKAREKALGIVLAPDKIKAEKSPAAPKNEPVTDDPDSMAQAVTRLEAQIGLIATQMQVIIDAAHRGVPPGQTKAE